MPTATLTREQVIDELGKLELDWGDEEDAVELVDLLLHRYTATEAITWLYWHNEQLGGSPLSLLERGKSREVFVEARGLVE